MKRATEGHASSTDLLILLEKGSETKVYLSFLALKRIFRRLGLNLTTHRLTEFISASKIKRLSNSVGTANINMANIHKSEFSYILDYMQEKIF